MKKMFLLMMLVFSVSVFAQKKVTNQYVEASCGMCNFDQKNDRGCALAVRMDNKVYYVEGTTIKDHGNPHADDGFCNVVKKAKVSGEIKDGKFYASSFALVPEKKSK